MKNIFKKSIYFLSHNYLGIHSVIFTLMAILNHSNDKFWMFLFASVLFQGLQNIGDILKSK